jgi:hypothetical protein
MFCEKWKATVGKLFRKSFVWKPLRMHICNEFGFGEALFNGVTTVEECDATAA